ncbi:MAG: acyl carrier protein [Bacteroidota bacterium]
MTREEIKSKLVEILMTVHTIDKKKLANVTEKTDFITDLGAPSTELVNIVAKAEEKFDIEFEDDDIDDLSSKMSATIDLILRYLNKKEASL